MKKPVIRLTHNHYQVPNLTCILSVPLNFFVCPFEFVRFAVAHFRASWPAPVIPNARRRA